MVANALSNCSGDLHPQGRQFYPKCAGRGLHLLFGKYVESVSRIAEDGHMGKLGNRFSQELEPLSFQVHRNRAQPGDVPAGLREARDETRANGIADSYHDVRNSRRYFLDGDSGGRSGCHKDLHFETYQFANQFGEAFIISFSPAILNDDVLPLDIAERAHPVAKRLNEIYLKGRGRISQKSYPGDFLRLLRVGERSSCQN